MKIKLKKNWDMMLCLGILLFTPIWLIIIVIGGESIKYDFPFNLFGYLLYLVGLGGVYVVLDSVVEVNK